MTTADPATACGTKNGYQRHLDHREDPCEPCKQANRDHMIEYNRRTGRGRARNRAYGRLRREQPDLFVARYIYERHRVIGEPGSVHVRRNRARQRALRWLGDTFPERFDALFAEERQRESSSRGSGDATSPDQ